MEKIALKVPFLLLSTRVNGSGETERRFLTPFGTLDLVFRPIWDEVGRDMHFQIDLKGDMENWLLPDNTFAEFKQTILHFIGELLQKQSKEGVRDKFKALSVQMKGSEMSLHMSCELKASLERTAGPPQPRVKQPAHV